MQGMKRIIFIVVMMMTALVSWGQKTVHEGLELIEKRYSVRFVFDSALNTNIPYRGELLGGESLSTDLNTLFYDNDIAWREEGGYIILRRANQYTIGGVVVDAISGERVVGALVIDKTTHQGDYSNGEALFSIKTKEGDRQLRVQHLGYKDRDILLRVTKDTLITITLEPNYTAVGDIIINNDSTFSTVDVLGKVTKAGALSLNVREMAYAPSLGGGQDIFKYLQTVAGVSPGGDGSSNLLIRGGMADETQILLDDVPIYNQSHGFGYLSIFSGEAVKSVELHKGYAAPSYGGRLSGVVDMRTRDGNRYEHKQSLSVGLTSASLNAEGPIAGGRGSYHFSGRFFTLLPILKIAYTLIPDSQMSGAPTYSFFDVTGRLTYDINDKHTLHLSSYSGSDYFDTQFINTDSVGVVSKGKSSMSWGNSVVSLRLNSILSERLFMNSTLYYSYLGNRVAAESNSYTHSDDFNSSITARMDEVGIKTNFDYRAGRNYAIDFGVQFSTQYFDPHQLESEKNGVLQYSGSFQSKRLDSYILYLNNRVTLACFDINIGARGVMYDNNNTKEYMFEPRLSISRNIGDRAELWASYTFNSQPLFSLNKRYISIPIDYWAPYTNNELSTSEIYSLGARYRVTKSLSITLEGYYKQRDNLTMVYDADEFLLSGDGYDKGLGEGYGIETFIQYSRGRLSLVGSYAYSLSDIIIDGVTRPYIFDTPHAASLLAIYNIVNSQGRKHTVSSNIIYRTGRPYMMGNEMYNPNWQDLIYYDNSSYVRLRDYFRVDISYTMERQLKRGSRAWQITISNVTNHKNPSIILPDTSVFNSDADNGVRAYSLLPFMPSFSYIRRF